MKPQRPLFRSRTSQKIPDIKLDRYKPRDWDYQSPKHQLRPQFVLGRFKKRAVNLSQKEFSIFKSPIKTTTSSGFYKRELKPSIFRSYNLSQIATLPGAVKVEESKINDDKHTEDLIKVVKNKDLCFINKIKQAYASNVAFLPGSQSKETQKEFTLGKSYSSYNFKNPKKKKKTNEKVMSPTKSRIKRNNKNKKMKK